MRNHTSFLPIIVSLIVAACALACTDEAVRDNKKPPLNDKKVPDKKNPDDKKTPEPLAEEYRKEGFISPDLFRVVIVQPADSSDTPRDVQRTAENRAFMSLQNYLRTRNIAVKTETRSAILTLIKNNGSGRFVDGGRTRKVYLFDIKKDNLRYSIDNIESR